MKRLDFHIIGAVLFCFSHLSAGVFSRLIQADLDQGRLSRPDAVYYEAIRGLRPDLLPERYIPDVRTIEKCAAPLIQQVRHFWPQFSAVQKSHLAPFAFRPELDHAFVSPDSRFRIHFDTDTLSAHHVPPEDADGSGIPDYVERAADYLMESYQVEIAEMGLQEPPPDADDSGPEWDVYLRNIPGYYGYVNIDQKVGADPDIYTTYMTLDNDYVHTHTKGLEALRVTIAHEFLHMIQYGYIFRDENRNGICDDQFLNEAASTWMEDRVYDDVNDYLYYLPNFFKRTNQSFDTFNGQREYGLCLWFHFLEKRFQGMDMLRRILNAMIVYPAMEACDAVLHDVGNTFADQLSLFYAWNMMTADRADTVRFYPEGHLYPQLMLDLNAPFHQDTLLTISVRPTASRYYGFTSDENTLYTLIATNTGMPVQASGNCLLGLRSGNDQPDYTPLDAHMQAGLFSDSDVLWECMGVVVPQHTLSSMVIIEPRHGTLTSRLTGTVWEDTDGDGLLAEGLEPGLYEVHMDLTEAGQDGLFDTGDDVIFPAAESMPSGAYEFLALYAGLYRIAVDPKTLPNGFLSTTGGFSRDINVPDSTHIQGIDFGFRELASRPAAIPNPFIPAEHGQVRIPVDLPAPQTIRLIVYSLSGFRVFEQEFYLTEGLQFLQWDGRGEHGDPVPSGVYLYLLEAEYQILRREKLVIVR